MEYNPEVNKMQFYQDGEYIQLSQHALHPTFIAKDVDELRANPETRKAL